MHRSIARAAAVVALSASPVFVSALAPAHAQTTRDRMRLLERTVQDLLERDAKREKELQRLRGEVRRLRGGRIRSATRRPPKTEGSTVTAQQAPKKKGHDHDEHDHREHGHDAPEIWSYRVGDVTYRLKRIGIDADFALGASSRKSETLSLLFAGGHDPRVNGFTLQSLDLSIIGSVDPYFDGVFGATLYLDTEGETRLELEEAYLQSKELWGFLKLKGGLFFAPFGVVNQLHLHDWEWQTQPVIASRLLGADGARGLGIQASAKLPLPWSSTVMFGAMNAFGETMPSFLANDEVYEERPIGGRAFNSNEIDSFAELVYFVRSANRFRLAPGTHLLLGGSAMFGPNATGNRGRTTIFGADATVRHDIGTLGRLTWRTEYMHRIFQAAADPNNGFAKDTLQDFGVYTQLLWDFDPKWGVGLRYEYATGTGPSVGAFASRGADPFRGDRHRIAPLLVWRFAPAASAKLQYTYDHATFLPVNDRNAHSLFLSLSWSFGLGAGHVHVNGDDHAHGH